MPIFRKKPVEIEARLFDSFTRTAELLDWIGDKADYDGVHIVIQTLEGSHNATLGDWIIRGIKGEFYPCKPDIFEAIYEAVIDVDRR